MACHLLCAKPLPEPVLTYFQLNPQEQTFVKKKGKDIFIQENAFDIVICKTSSIFCSALNVLSTVSVSNDNDRWGHVTADMYAWMK